MEAEKEGKKKVVVYTSGTWDLFHIGHLNLIRRSKELGDTLIVAVSTDELVESYKEAAVIPFEERCEIVKACKYVDGVVKQVVLSEIRQIKEINPDIITIGSDWKNKYLEGLEWFKNQPGKKLVYLPYTKHTSSTKIKQKVTGKINNENKENHVD